jgi:malate dehydrogenase (oxaloacetate-decarboxylating)
MKLAAAHAIAETITDHELSADYIIPSVFNRHVATSVADAVATAAHHDGIARKAIEPAAHNQALSWTGGPV